MPGFLAPGVCWLKIEPTFARLRSEPRFQTLVAKIGLPD